MVKRHAVVLVLMLLWPLSAGCTATYTHTLRAQILDLEEYLEKAQAAQGPLCEPQALARAQTCLASAKEEFQEGDYWEAEDILDICRKEAEGLWDRILACDRDRDADGIPDPYDRCPDDAQIYTGYLDQDGCPHPLPEWALLAVDRIEIIEPLGFHDEDQSVLAASRKVLRDVARILLEHPGIRVRIQAHMDDRYPPERNMEITRSRAAAVRDTLADMGVAVQRLEAVGMGSTEPIAPGDSPLGRLVNQRVEFLRIPGNLPVLPDTP